MFVRCAEWPARFKAGLLALLATGLMVACGGGTSTTVTYSGPGLLPGTAPVAEAVQSNPTGPNTTEVLVDSGPPGFGALGTANVPYVTVTVCAPGSSTACVTIDHVILDTGSYGLRVLSSKVGALGLPSVQLTSGAVTGAAVECYQFVLGGLWGPLAQADVLIGGEKASQIPIQLIDDQGLAGPGPTADCLVAASNLLLTSASALQGNGVLGVGAAGVDCGQVCAQGNYSVVKYHPPYYVCPDAVALNCQPTAIANDQQVQNPVAHFDANADGTRDNNGTIISMPGLPVLGAGAARGRLVFGIGTQANNQITVAASANTIYADINAANYDTTYLSFTATVGNQSYSQSYIDSGSNAYFFDDAALSLTCDANDPKTPGGWYCPKDAQGRNTTLNRQATFTDVDGNAVAVSFSLTSADALFGAVNPLTGGRSTAFANLSGTAGQGGLSFVWGMPFFYGRSVYTSIWDVPKCSAGTRLYCPWNAF